MALKFVVLMGVLGTLVYGQTTYPTNPPPLLDPKEKTYIGQCVSCKWKDTYGGPFYDY